jgi:Tol biopolymer transport system component
VYATRFVIPASEKQAFLSSSISPDGRRLVYGTSTEGKQQLWIRQLDSLTAQPLPGTDKAFGRVVWSPDSRYICFFADGKLKKMDLSGGPAQPLADAPDPAGGSWNQDGVIVFSPSGTGPLYRVSATGGEVKQLTTLDESRRETSHRSPFFLPDGRHFLYIVRSVQPRENNEIYVGSLDSKEPKRITSADSDASYAPPGYVLFVREGTLMAQTFDADRREVTGEAFPIIERIRFRPGPGLAEFSVSSNGVLVYMTGNLVPNQLTWFDRSGKQLGTAGPPGAYNFPRLSPDEKRVAVERIDPPAVSSDIWLIELARSVASRFTSDPGNDFFPVWSPDGSRIAFSSNREGQFNLYQKLSSGAGGDEELLKSGETKFMEDWSPDGQFILYRTQGGKTRADIWVLPLFGDRKPSSLLQTDFAENWARFSPNGKWIAYQSDETRTREVYVREFQGSSGSWRVSTGGGVIPRWRRDGKELFYNGGGKLMAVDVKENGSSFEAGIPKVLFEGIRALSYDVSGDGQRFLIAVPVEESTPESITVVLNWTADLKP